MRCRLSVILGVGTRARGEIWSVTPAAGPAEMTGVSPAEMTGMSHAEMTGVSHAEMTGVRDAATTADT